MIVADAHLHTGTEIREEKRTPKIKVLYFLYPDRINAKVNAKVSGWKGDGQKKKKRYTKFHPLSSAASIIR